MSVLVLQLSRLNVDNLLRYLCVKADTVYCQAMKVLGVLGAVESQP